MNKAKVQSCEDGYIMLCTDGDILAVPEPNHPAGDEGDAKNFQLFADAYNGVMMRWVQVPGAMIDPKKMYLVKTNGAEWRDSDVWIRPGFALVNLMEPNVVRGRPLYIAEITNPEEPNE